MASSRRTSPQKSTGETKRVFDAFRNLVRALRIADRAGLKQHGLGAAQIFVLHQLQAESPLSVNDLAERTATDQSTVSVVVNKLIDRGLVDRQWAEADARRSELSLSTDGKKIAKRLPVPFQELFLAGLRSLPESRTRVLADTLEDILDSMGVSRDGAPPMLLVEQDSTPARRSSAKKSVAPAKKRRG